MGTVHLARRGRRQAALKLVHPSLAADPEFRRRFEREVAISRAVSGPHVASVIDADPSADRPWLAIEHVPGPTLAQAGALGGDQGIAVALALLSALSDIHRAGVSHRDLKPSNVILADRGPVVIDFGIAAAADATSLTQTGTVLGSAGWMAPEQLRGEETGPAADVFAWAATVCFAIIGRSPFGAGRPDALAYRVAHEEPDLTGVGPELAPILMTALAKDPAQRPEVDDLLRDVRAMVSARDTVVGTASLTDAVTELWRPVPYTSEVPRRGRSKALLAGAAVVTMLIVGASVAGWSVWRDRQEDPDEATSAEVVAVTMADSTSTSTSTTSSTEPATTVPPTTTTAPPPPTTTTPPTTTSPPPVDPVLEGLFDPASDADIGRFLDFASAHLQQVVRLDVGWEEDLSGQSPTVSGQPEWEPGVGLLYAPGPCLDYPYCGGMEVLFEDLDVVSDAGLFYDSGVWVMSGRFAVQSVIASNGGVMSVSLRAVPID